MKDPFKLIINIVKTLLNYKTFAQVAENFTAAAPTLRDLGEKRGVLMGSALNMWHVKLDEKYDENFKREYAIATAESDCKWNAIRPSQDEFKLDACVEHF